MSLLIIALKYLEPSYQHTVNSINALKGEHEIIYANRDGVGNYSRAFNEAFWKWDRVQGNHSVYRGRIEKIDYVWLISNITFSPDVPGSLIKSMDDTQLAAIHPAMAGSDHQHEWPDGSYAVKEVPFIEMTAPIIRYDIFKHYPLDEVLQYWYMDLDFAYRLKKAGHKLGVDHAAQIGHTYLRDDKRHPISRLRDRLRAYHKSSMQERMIEKYGHQWRQEMGWKE